MLRQAQVITEISLGANNPRLVRIIAQQAALFSIQQNYSQAETLYARALAALEASVPEHHPNIFHLRCKLAWCYYKQFKLDQAEQYRRKALEGKDKFFGNEYPNFAKTLQEPAEICSKLAKYDQVTDNFLCLIIKGRNVRRQSFVYQRGIHWKGQRFRDYRVVNTSCSVELYKRKLSKGFRITRAGVDTSRTGFWVSIR